MKTIRRFTVAAAVLLIMLLALCAASAENLLENPDFLHLDEEEMPVGWYTDAYILEPGYSVFKHEGDAEHRSAVSIQNIGENDARFAQTVSVEPNSIYLLSGYVRAEGVEGGHGANLSVDGIYAFSDKYYDTDGKWEYIQYYGETGPEQQFLTVYARLGGYSGVSTGKAWFADLSLTKVDSIPGDGVADLWYLPDSEWDDTSEEEEEDNAPGAFYPWLLLIGFAYTLLAVYLIWRERMKQPALQDRNRFYGTFAAIVLLLSLLLRMLISRAVEGYMVDVNCFLSWGHTMASAGPAGFYEATSFCDYPPLYTYILALNARVSDLLGGSAEISRIVFRLIPNLCDLAGCWILYRLLLKEAKLNRSACFLFLALAAFHPASILNSAAWGQMDSALCLLLLCVALCAVRGRWKVALPLYVIAVLVKPQALMLGPLGLAYIVLSWIRNPSSRRKILIGTGISIIVLIAGVLPFSLRQNWDWLIQLYARTLASYPYATVNTANFYYIIGGNWSGVDSAAHLFAPLLLGACCAGYGVWWYFRAKELRGRAAEFVISICFAICFAVFALKGASWTWNGAAAMAFVFVIVLSHAVRSGEIRLLPWLGGLLFILLYVFGVKMHERYIFPALMLLAAGWIMLRDRRILYVLLLFSLTLFINEGIVLDNSIRLGSSLGHLNRDTVWLADLVCIANVCGAVYAVWLGIEILLPRQKRAYVTSQKRTPLDWKCDRKLHWNLKDMLIVTAITVSFAAVSLLTLGSTKAPQTLWSSSTASEQVVLDLGKVWDDFEVLYFAQVTRNDFSVSVSDDGENWEEETWAQMDQGQCWKWKYVTESYENGDGTRTYVNANENSIIRFSGRYVRITSQQLGLRLNEVLIRDEAGEVIPVRLAGRTGEDTASELCSDPSALIDEQDSMEGLPSFPYNQETDGSKIQPSWWNSSYFDEIYHARTAYEFLNGTVPYETSHPPLGKILMSVFVAVFGMTPFGWRFAGALAGILMLPGMYLLGKQLTKKTWAGALACGLMALDCMHLTQTQIATIDSFPVLFIIFAYFFMLRFLQTDFLREKTSVSLISLGCCGLFMGLSIASKWIGIYAGAGLAVLFFWHSARTIRLQKDASGMLKNDPALPEESRGRLLAWSREGGAPDAVRRFLTLCAWCVLFFIIVPVLIYLISYIPYMAYNAKRIHSLGDYINEVWRAQVGMFNYHSTPNLGMDHPFYSPWWEWPVIGKPMYYASQQYLPADYPVHHSIFAFGNPVIWYGGLATLAFCLYRCISSRRYRLAGNQLQWHAGALTYNVRYVFLLIGILAQYLPWVLVPRGTYIYHYFASLPFLMISVCLAFDLEGQKAERTGRILAAVFIAAAAVFFILLFPYASGMNVSPDWLNIGRNILRIWY